MTVWLERQRERCERKPARPWISRCGGGGAHLRGGLALKELRVAGRGGHGGRPHSATSPSPPAVSLWCGPVLDVPREPNAEQPPEQTSVGRSAQVRGLDGRQVGPTELRESLPPWAKLPETSGRTRLDTALGPREVLVYERVWACGCGCSRRSMRWIDL